MMLRREKVPIKIRQDHAYPAIVKNHKRNFVDDFYHSIIRSNWVLFFASLAGTYLFFNFIFACLYYFGDFGISNVEHTFWNSFHFSIQTSSTIGYGYMSPTNDYANFLVSIEAALSLLFTAIATGLTFAKFSRPTARLMFTKNILITDIDRKRTLMFRMYNERSNYIIHAKVSVVLALDHVTAEGIPFKRLYDIDLVRSDSPLISLTWTVMHTIDKESPLYGLTIEELIERRALFIISLKGIDDTFSQTIHSKHYYQYSDIVFNQHFQDMITSENERMNMPEIDVHNFHKLTKL